MSDFVPKLCPLCSLELAEDDEVHVCESCGTAHHQSCWEETGTCGNEQCSAHAKNEPESAPAPAVMLGIFCGNCGMKLKESQAFCPRCGTPAPKRVVPAAASVPVVELEPIADENAAPAEAITVEVEPVTDGNAVPAENQQIIGSESGNSSEQAVPVMADVQQTTILDSYADITLAIQLISDLEEKSVTATYYPLEQDDLWYCTCGTQNTKQDELCRHCGVVKEELFAALDPVVLEEHVAAAAAAREAAEQQVRESREKKTKKLKRGFILSASVIILTLITVFFIIPYVRYTGAEDAVRSGNYAEAIATYEDLGDFMESRQHRTYAKALKQIQDGEIEEGIRALLGKGVGVDLYYGMNEGKFVSPLAVETTQLRISTDFEKLEDVTRDYYDFLGWELTGLRFDPKYPSAATVDVGAMFTPIEYTIRYESEGDFSNNNPGSFNYETATITLNAPQRVGYTFVAWENEDGTAVTELPTKNHGEKVFRATWTPNVYTVTIQPGEYAPAKGESFEKTQFEVTYDAEYSLPAAQKAGYTFLGWQDASGTYLTGVWQTAQDLTLQPSFELTNYALVYDLKGGELATPNPAKYNTETETFTLNNPTRAGYQFTGWTWEDQSKATTTAVLEKGAIGDKHFVAHWKGNPHTVTLDPAGGSVSKKTVNVVMGSEFTLPTPAKTGQTFKGWVNNGTTYTSGSKWSVDKDLTLTATWTPKKYTVKLNANGGSCSSSSVTTTYGSNYSLPTPTRKGYTFQGWSYNGTAYSGGVWKTDAEITLTAQWKGKTYNVTLNGNGGTVSPSKETAVFGEAYAFPIPYRQGYEFLGWSTSSSSYSTVDYPARGTWNYDGNVTLYAKWQQARYTLVIDAAGGNFSGSLMESVTYGQRVYLGSMSRAGYEFEGWYYGDTKLGTSSFYYNYEESITVTARWTPKTYRVTLSANGGSVSPSSYTFIYDCPYSLPTPTRSGYIFDGWYDSTSSYADYYPSDGVWTETSNPYTLYAHWIKK